MTTTLVAALVAIVGGLGTIVLYNRLVAGRLRVREAWSVVDVQLARRASLIPNLVDVVRGYAAYERDTLARVTAARTALDAAASRPAIAAEANDRLSGALQGIAVLAEAYPDLKADEQFLQLQRDLADTENLIARARNYYNGAVELYNTRVQSFPGLLVAGVFGFRPAEFFRAVDQ